MAATDATPRHCPGCGRWLTGVTCPCGYQPPVTSPRDALATYGGLRRTEGTGSKAVHAPEGTIIPRTCPGLSGATRDAVQIMYAAAIPLRASLCTRCFNVEVADD